MVEEFILYRCDEETKLKNGVQAFAVGVQEIAKCTSFSKEMKAPGLIRKRVKDMPELAIVQVTRTRP